uniref:Uncharacterized protein n=1 Tax=Anopheles culicifacies TaxID=139723 RepID=A0A182MSZ8_9DIPT
MRFLMESDGEAETEDIKQSLPTSTAKGRETAKRPVPSGIAVKSPLSSPASIADRPLSKPITVKRIVQTLSPTVMPNIRDCKRRFIDSTVYSLPKLRRPMPNSSVPVASSPISLDGPSDSFTSKVEPFIVKTFQNLSTITDKIAQTEASPYSGLLNHLSMVVSRKRASDFNQIEGVLLNCLSELHKFPNATKDSTRDSPATIVLDDSDRRDQVREDSNDSYG